MKLCVFCKSEISWIIYGHSVLLKVSSIRNIHSFFLISPTVLHRIIHICKHVAEQKGKYMCPSRLVKWMVFYWRWWQNGFSNTSFLRYIWKSAGGRHGTMALFSEVFVNGRNWLLISFQINNNTLKKTNLVRCNAVLSGSSILMFGRNVLRATSGSRSKPSKQKGKQPARQ